MSTYIEISHTIFNAPTDSIGEELDYITFVPNTTIYHDPSLSVSSYNWTILEIQSNFKNATGYETHATIAPVGNTDKINPLFRLSNIKDGEVVFVNLGLNVEFSDGSSGAARANIVLYRGDPINTSFVIQTQKNGRLKKEYIFDRAIEEQIMTASMGDASFFTENYNTVQGQNPSISQYLQRKKDLESRGLSWSDVSNFDQTLDQDGQVESARDDKFAQSATVQFIKNELALYAHGRSLDLLSIQTLLYQNPGNFFRGSDEAPDPMIYMDAVDNWYRSPPGFNAIVVPYLNPFLGEAAKFYFPGRSSHGGGSGSNLVCSDVTIDFTWAPPTYPPDCPPGSSAFICTGSDSITVPYCFEKVCQSC